MKAGPRREAKLAAETVVVGGALSFVVATVAGSSWGFGWIELLVAVTVWLSVAVVGWRAPMLAAYAMIVVAVWGFLLAFAVALGQGISEIGSKQQHADHVFGVAFAWWVLLPTLASVLFLGAEWEADQRTQGPRTISPVRDHGARTHRRRHR
jgi:hypothetical protein